MELMTMGLENVGTYGFPTVVAGWFMFRLEKILTKLTDKVNNCPMRAN